MANFFIKRFKLSSRTSFEKILDSKSSVSYSSNSIAQILNFAIKNMKQNVLPNWYIRFRKWIGSCVFAEIIPDIGSVVTKSHLTKVIYFIFCF